MKSKISVIVGSVLALAITATAPVHAKGGDYTGQNLSVDNSVQPPQQKPQTPIYRVAGGYR
jgi:hypothetical protein